MVRNTILIGLVFAAVSATAKVSLDTDRGNTTFRVNGQIVSSVEAMKAAVAGAKVYRCKPKKANDKKITFAGNQQVTEVVECTEVELKINPKTGSPSWKNVK